VYAVKHIHLLFRYFGYNVRLVMLDNASPECIGFDAARAEHIAAWSCWSCNPPIAGLEK